ncbi:transporter substrate-binding domain-containing protein [Paraneptunicella aestuarii]|uniref:substrate-binding periplasmic protein n=1 Tax=Paraneptunicella aestuarii TaxID=2831148 RepID=UPI001E3B5963|nr:transporter substrate-binding domain-containing protein [Paraneptunicella aestuarii]UAA38198.1 transporter substrate-binding domain-containing protein [Paraneptunicella aestuarii]
MLARTLEAAVGWTKPPYIIAETDSGFELDLVRQVMKSLGHKINPIYVPYGRSYSMLENNQVDLTLTLSEQVGVHISKLSDVYVTYQNVAISLKKSNVTINQIADLQHYSVVAFQNARMLLNKTFSDAVAKNDMYIELPYQRNQVEMLFNGNTDVVVMDINIFNHLSRELTGKNQMEKVNVHNLFPLNHYRVGFADPVLRYDFNQALGNFVETQEYRDLVKKYDLHTISIN